MPRPVKEIEHGPPPIEVPWLATPNGRYYDHEKDVEDERVLARRKTGAVVYAQTAYAALQMACRELRLATEHIDLKQQEVKPKEEKVSNSYLQFCEALSLKSPEEEAWFRRYLDASNMDDESNWDGDFNPKTDEAKFWAPVLNEDEESMACFESRFADIDGKRCLVVYSEDHANTDHIAKLVQHFFREMRPEGKDGFTLSWAETCDKSLPGQFGGGALFVTKDEVHYLSTWQWLSDWAQQLHVE